MEVEEISDGSHCTARNIQKIISCTKKDSAESLNKNNNTISLVTEKNILEMFENNEQYMEYFVSLKEALIESRRKGDICWCDPRDSKMKERLELARWTPRVVFKLGDEASSEEFGVSSKQIALDEDGQNKEVDDCADVDAKLGNDGQDCGQDKEVDDCADVDAKLGNDGQDCRQDKNEKRTNIIAHYFPKVTDNSKNLREFPICFKCGLHGCKQRFSSLASYESHYHACHNHVCAACKNSFVSNFLLDIHLQESHDSYFQILSPRIDMFRCLVESCELKFKTPDLRKDHLVRVHQLPANFMFHKPVQTKGQKSKRTARTTSTTHSTGDNIQGHQDLSSSSLLSQPSSPSPSMEVEPAEATLPGPASAAEKVARNVRGKDRKVPQTVCFGRGARKAFQNRRPDGRTQHWHQIGALDMDTVVDIEKVDFADMIDSLESAQ